MLSASFCGRSCTAQVDSLTESEWSFFEFLAQRCVERRIQACSIWRQRFFHESVVQRVESVSRHRLTCMPPHSHCDYACKSKTALRSRPEFREDPERGVQPGWLHLSGTSSYVSSSHSRKARAAFDIPTIFVAVGAWNSRLDVLSTHFGYCGIARREQHSRHGPWKRFAADPPVLCSPCFRRTQSGKLFSQWPPLAYHFANA